jgi:BioD-like phosphotransacetylase family protein
LNPAFSIFRIYPGVAYDHWHDKENTVNTVTPRIFIAATQQDDGKTTTSIGLFAALKKRLGRIGYIKPVGQRFTDIEGMLIDEDSVLIENTYEVQIPLEAMSPIAVEPDFTRKYIEHGNIKNLTDRIQHSFDRAAWEKEFTIIEGTGHAGVGSVFDLSNARVAQLLASKVLIVTKGGIGKPIDEIALNKALFDQQGVEVVGVILNKVLPEKFDYIEKLARRGLERLGIDLLGVLPVDPILAKPTLQQICERIKGRFVSGTRHCGRRHVTKVIIGAMTPANLLPQFKTGTLVITPGDREDVILAAIASHQPKEGSPLPLVGFILSADHLPHPRIMEQLAASGLPAIASPLDSYSVASSIHSMTVKTMPGDHQKIETIQQMVEKHVEIDRLLEKISSKPK